MNGASYKDLKKYCYFSSMPDSAVNSLSIKLQSFELPADAFYHVKKSESFRFSIITNRDNQ